MFTYLVRILHINGAYCKTIAWVNEEEKLFLGIFNEIRSKIDFLGCKIKFQPCNLRLPFLYAPRYTTEIKHNTSYNFLNKPSNPGIQGFVFY